MANVKYFIVGKKEFVSIHMRFQAANIDIKKTTGLKVNKNHFNTKTGRLKNVTGFENYMQLRTQLRELKNFVIDAYNQDLEKQLDAGWLKQVIKGYFTKDLKQDEKKKEDALRFTDFIAEYVLKCFDYAEKGIKGYSSGKAKKYRTVYNILSDFEKQTNKRIYLEKYTLGINQEITEWLLNERQYNQNYVGRLCGAIKTLLLEAQKVKDIDLHKDIKYLKKTIEKALFQTLDDAEIQAIENLDLIGGKEDVRDWLLIGLHTGQRISDLLRMNSDMLKESKNGNKYIELIQVKGRNVKFDSSVNIPLLPPVESILKKRNGQFPLTCSHKHFNETIKEIAKEAGITDVVLGSKRVKVDLDDKNKGRTSYRVKQGYYPKNELVTSHICRRSFATNYYLKGYPIAILSTITGHESEAQFLKYIGMSKTRAVDDMISLFERMED